LAFLDGGLIALDLRDKLGDRGLLVGDLLKRHRVLFGEVRVAREVLLRVLLMRLFVGEGRLGLIELSLESAGVYLCENITLLDKLTLLKVDARDQARDPGCGRSRC
jgi:hypothetical protein